MCDRLGHNKWVRLFALTLCAALLAAPLPADADDWSVKRSAFDPRAVARFDRMLAARPTDGYAFRQLTRLYSKHRSLAALTRKWEARARAAPRSAGPRIVLGRLMMLSRSWPRAAAHFAAAAELQPGRDWAMAGLASALEKQGKLTEAAAAYKVALTRTRKTSRKKRYLAALAHLSASAGDHAAAAEHHRALATLEPRSRAHKLALARALSRAGKNAEALATLEPLLASTRDSTRRVELLKELGRLQGAMGNLDAAVAHYRKAMSLTARGHWLRRELTDAIIDIHRKQEKLPDLIKDLERRWKRRGAFEDEVLGKLYDETGDEERALAAYRAAVRRAPHLVQLRLRIIALLERSGRSEEVLLEYRTLARMAPGEPRHEGLHPRLDQVLHEAHQVLAPQKQVVRAVAEQSPLAEEIVALQLEAQADKGGDGAQGLQAHAHGLAAHAQLHGARVVFGEGGLGTRLVGQDQPLRHEGLELLRGYACLAADFTAGERHTCSQLSPGGQAGDTRGQGLTQQEQLHGAGIPVEAREELADHIQGELVLIAHTPDQCQQPHLPLIVAAPALAWRDQLQPQVVMDQLAANPCSVHNFSDREACIELRHVAYSCIYEKQ